MSPNIVIIDDEQALCELLSDSARELGYHPSSAQHISALDDLLPLCPQVFVLDLMMPDGDGIELLRRIADKQPHSHIILMSGTEQRILSSAAEIASSLGLHVRGTLSKPFRLQAFCQLLSAHTHSPPLPADTTNLSDAITAAEMQGAIEHNQLVVHYQPQVSFRTRQLVSMEALVRWQHPERGLIYPDQFITCAENNQLIAALTHDVLRNALQMLQQWHKHRPALGMAVNISATTLTDLNWPDELHHLLQQARIPPSALTLEITESSLMQDPDRSLEILTRLRLKGFRLSIDDFGTGYSSLQQLGRIPASELKIDKSFTFSMQEKPHIRVMIDETIHLAHRLKMDVVAEGVETAAVWHALQQAGCDVAQGYLLGKPLAPGLISSLITNPDWPYASFKKQGKKDE